jgi:hypothetical protein
VDNKLTGTQAGRKKKYQNSRYRMRNRKAIVPRYNEWATLKIIPNTFSLCSLLLSLLP